MRNLFKILLFLGLFSIAIPGCGPSSFLIGPAVTGVVYWMNGEAHKYYEEDTEVIHRATRHALTELGVAITQNEPKGNGFYLLAGTENRFAINISKQEGSLSCLSIRINYVGDKDFAELIYKKVDEQLNIIHYDEQGNPTRKSKWLGGNRQHGS